MKIKDRVKNTVKGKYDMETDNIDKLIVMAYYIGREDAAKDLCDKYTMVRSNQKEQARKSRYHNMAQRILGPVEHLYSTDYNQTMTDVFGDDETRF